VGLGLYAAGGGYENWGPGESTRSRWEALGEWVGRENASWVEVRVRLRVVRLPELELDWLPKIEEMAEKKDIDAKRVLCVRES
jgi:hypothetical protein